MTPTSRIAVAIISSIILLGTCFLVCNLCIVLRRALSIKRGLRAKKLAGITNGSARHRGRRGEM